MRVTFESDRLLLQREDFTTAHRALRKIAKDVPGFFRAREAVAKSEDLASALAAGELPGRFDEHGDLIGIRYVGDKFPPGGPDDFPEQLIFGWKKLLRDTRFDLSIEGMQQTERFFVDRGVVESILLDRTVRRFEQLAAPPRCRPGESVQLSFRYTSDLPQDDVALQVKASDSSEPFAVDFAQRTMHPEDVATLTVRMRTDHTWYPEGEIGPMLYGDAPGTYVRNRLRLVADIPEDLDAEHEVLATESTGWIIGSGGIYLHAKRLAAAMEDVRRYAARHSTAPGGAFLARAAAAADIGGALRAASFEATFEQGHLRSIAFTGRRLPGSERHVVGMLRSFAGLTGAKSPHLRFSYASTPEWWTTLAFDPKGVRRAHQPRPAARAP